MVANILSVFYLNREDVYQQGFGHLLYEAHCLQYVTIRLQLTLLICREERRTADGKCDEDVKIVAVDLQAMAPIPGVIQIQGDITKVFYIAVVTSKI